MARRQARRRSVPRRGARGAAPRRGGSQRTRAAPSPRGSSLPSAPRRLGVGVGVKVRVSVTATVRGGAKSSRESLPFCTAQANPNLTFTQASLATIDEWSLQIEAATPLVAIR